MLKENEAIVKTRSDVVKKEKGTVETFESFFGTERDCWKIVILGIKCEYTACRHLVGEYCSWRQTMFETWLF